MSDWFTGSGSGSPVDAVALVADASDQLAALVSLGALVSVGTTSDGGAMAITVTLDGRWRREYFRETEAMRTWLGDAIDAVSTAPAAPTASSGPRQRPRGRRAP